MTKARSWIYRLLKLALFAVAGIYFFWIASLIALGYVDPPTTGVQIQRRLEAIVSRSPYHKRQKWIPLGKSRQTCNMP